jgi:hypothetical protein
MGRGAEARANLYRRDATVAVIAWLGQAAQCQRGTVLPRDYLSSEDTAYLPGVAEEIEVPEPSGRVSWLFPIALGAAVVALYWTLR